MTADASIEWLPEEKQGVRIGRRGTHIIIRWRGLGEMVTGSTEGESQFSAHPGADPVLLEKFRVTSLMAARRYLAGRMSLHGSAVGLPAGVVAFVGECGAGKSTTATALVERCGATFFADDIVPVDWRGLEPWVSPVQDSFWLGQDACDWFGQTLASTEKIAYPPKVRSLHPEPLDAIVHLEFDDTASGIRLERVTGHDAFMVLSRAHVCYSAGKKDDALRNLAVRASLAAGTRVLRLRRPRSLENLLAVARLLAS